MPSKNEIRQRLLRERKSLDGITVTHLSQFIQNNIIESNRFLNSRRIAIYDAIRNEVRTDVIVQTAFQSNKEVYFPHWDPEEAAIRFYQVTDLEHLEATTWGTREPRPEPANENTRFDFDLIIVPGIAFDKKGYRLGYGFGGYDRILAGIAERAWGLAFDFQIVDSLPTEPHDVPCARVITERRLIEII